MTKWTPHTTQEIRQGIRRSITFTLDGYHIRSVQEMTQQVVAVWQDVTGLCWTKMPAQQETMSDRSLLVRVQSPLDNRSDAHFIIQCDWLRTLAGQSNKDTENSS